MAIYCVVKNDLVKFEILVFYFKSNFKSRMYYAILIDPKSAKFSNNHEKKKKQKKNNIYCLDSKFFNK